MTGRRWTAVAGLGAVFWGSYLLDAAVHRHLSADGFAWVAGGWLLGSAALVGYWVFRPGR